jgi:DNA modification methylase
MTQAYQDFLRSKMVAAPERGISIDADEVNPLLKPHQRVIVRWALRKGCAAIFAAFGLGKTLMQLEIARLISRHTCEPFLITAPLGVRQEFRHDANLLGVDLTFIRSTEEAKFGAPHIYLTNYESVREGKIDPRKFGGASLDEAAILRGFGGTKTFREFMRLYENGQVRYKFVATATPSPNKYIELLAYAAFLDVMDVSQAKTRFFKRDSTKADNLTLHATKEREFWLWVSSWAIFLQTPEDLGFDGSEYVLPDMHVEWHELPSDHTTAPPEKGGQGRLIRSTALGVTHAAREKKDSLQARVARVRQLVDARDLLRSEQFIVWCDRNDEQRAIDHTVKEMGISLSSLYGDQNVDVREGLLAAWKNRETTAFVSKPVMYGAGVNLQQCATAFYVGIGFKFAEFIQSVKRIHRFLQTKTVRIHLIYTEAEREVRRVLEEKWQKHNELVAQMSAIIREYGLATNALEKEFGRSLGVERTEAAGESWKMVHNDAVLETAAMPDASVHLVLSSIPFSTQYEYSPSYNDFGHTETNEQFWEQMGFLIPELHRVLQPGRAYLIHVKDRIVPGGLNGMGFQTAYPFHCDAIRHFCRHGFAYLGMKTIVTDVVRENNQTYRLGWTEQCKDGSRMGVGMPEYLLIFRKPPTDSSKGYADVPVVKEKAEYSRSRWQIDAHGFARSSGNRLLSPEDLQGVPHERIFKMFREFSRTQVYDFERHVALSESLETCQECGHIHLKPTHCDREIAAHALGPEDPNPLRCPCRGAGRLPVTFMLLQPQSWHPDVWTDITRMLSLNSAQAAKGKELHLCPLQFDLADRVIAQFTMKGETVYDPFGGLGTVALRAIKLGRKGIACELAASYWRDACFYLEAAERQMATPSLFDLLAEDVTEEVSA